MHLRKYLLIFFASILIDSCCNCRPQGDSKIVFFENKQDENGYQFGYYTDYGTSRNEKGEFQTKGNEEVLVVNGDYKYTDTDGKTYKVTYVADENGYRAKVETEKEPQAIPAAALASLAGGGLG